MTKPGINWGQARRFFESHGFEIRTGNRGGEKRIIAPHRNGQTRASTVVGHRYCIKKTQVLSPAYIAQFRRTFGIEIAHLTGKKKWTLDQLPA